MKTDTKTDSTYLGTKIPNEPCRQFGVRAAEQGKSKAALLKELVLNFVAGYPLETARCKKEGRAAI